MDTTEHLIEFGYNQFYYKKFNINSTKTLFLIPGQSLSPRSFWEKHINHFKCNVIMFDPVGYGKSITNKLPENYTRDLLNEQLGLLFSKERTEENTILGFCATTANCLKSFELGFDKAIILGPSIIENTTREINEGWFHNNKEKLIKERFGKISDKLVPKQIGNFRYDGWDSDVPEIWRAPKSMVLDIKTYFANNKTHNINFSLCENVLGIIGEYDYEPQATGGLALFKKYVPEAKIARVKNTTHFIMWEHNYLQVLGLINNYVLQSLYSPSENSA